MQDSNRTFSSAVVKKRHVYGWTKLNPVKIQKAEELLDSATYKCLNRDPMSTVLRRTDTLIKHGARREGSWTRHYGLLKTHKQDVPLRPTVSVIGSPTGRHGRPSRNRPWAKRQRVDNDDVHVKK